MEIHSNENHSNSGEEGTPLKYETGDVTIDLKTETERLKKLADANSSQMVNLYLNQGKEGEWKSTQLIFSQANTAFLRGRYRDSRRLFRQGLNDMDKQANDFVQVYNAYFDKYTGELNTQIIEIKSNREKYDPNPNLLPHLERKAKEAGVFFRQAEFLVNSKRPILALKYYQLATIELLEGVIRGKKELASNIENNDKADESVPSNNTKSGASEKIYLDVDYLTLEDRKVWDESHNLSHVNEEEGRKKERERIDTFLKSKLREPKEPKEQQDTQEPNKVDAPK
ncbi:MAG: hypothetical protein JJT78_09940 [Leptospira sp.]|nr:hypothetical protein [Leptospira sp.]